MISWWSIKVISALEQVLPPRIYGTRWHSLSRKRWVSAYLWSRSGAKSTAPVSTELCRTAANRDPNFQLARGILKKCQDFFGLATLSTGVMAGICFSSEHPRLSMSSTPIEGWGQVLRGGSIIKLGFCSMIYILSGFHSSGHIRWFWILVSSGKTPVWSNFQCWIPTSLLGQFIMMLWCFLLSV